MSNAQLSGRVAIVTGASSGIGRATAKLFAHHGARVVVTARRRPELEALVSEIAAAGGEAIALPGDLRDEALAAALVARAVEQFGGLDIAFNNAATVGELGPTVETSHATWREVLDTNLTSAFLGAKHQVPALRARGGGSLIFTSSFVGHTVGMPGMGAYAASKSGLLGLMRTLAAELGPERIRVNAILPGGTLTPSAPSSDEARAFVRSIHALKRMAEPEEIARAVLYLASDASSFMTGTAMLVDGGVSITRT
jgi:NAD(P)-dependent dehydrogenase (short-subunit alcohol dehydrogenase family)